MGLEWSLPQIFCKSPPLCYTELCLEAFCGKQYLLLFLLSIYMLPGWTYQLPYETLPSVYSQSQTVYFHGGNESIFSVTNRASFLSFEMALSPPMRILTGPNIVEKSSLFRRVLVLLEDCYSQIPARLRRSILSGIPASDLWFPLRTEAKCMKSALTPVFGAVTTHRLNQVAIKHFMQMYTKRNPSYLMGSTIPAVHS